MKWVLLKKYCELSGETRHSFNGKVRANIYVMGKHFKKVDNRIWVNTQAMDKLRETSRVA